MFSFASGKCFWQWCTVVGSMQVAAACGVAIPAVQCKTPATIMQVAAGGGVVIPADQCGTGATICSSRIPLFNGRGGLSIMGLGFRALRGLLFANFVVHCGVESADCGVQCRLSMIHTCALHDLWGVQGRQKSLSSRRSCFRYTMVTGIEQRDSRGATPSTVNP